MIPHDTIANWHSPREIPFRFLAALAICTGLSSASGVIADDRASAVLLTGPKYRQALAQPLSGSWTNIELRSLLNEVAAERHISILLDRRLNPSVELPIDISNVPLQIGLTTIARRANGDIAILENCVFSGPRSATKSLRTLIELRSIELQSNPGTISKKRRSELMERRTFAWIDLDTPREILDQITQPSGLTISNAELVPHDLWAAATLPAFTLPEALSVFLIQFDLTFRWINGGDSIELIPVPETVTLERKHRSKRKPADAISAIRQRFPKVDIDQSTAEIVVRGTVEEHEAIANLLRGTANGPVRIETPDPIRNRKFLLKAERTPVSAVMRKLEESAISFDYDATELKAAGIDLEKQVSIDVKNVSAADFFKALFDPIGADFEIDELTVRLKPKAK